MICCRFTSSIPATIFSRPSSVDRARVDRELLRGRRGGRATLVQAVCDQHRSRSLAGPTKAAVREAEISNARALLGLTSERIILRVDRLDYTKGIPDRIRAFERMLVRHPEWKEKVVLVQIGAPSRDQLARYQALSREVDETVETATAPTERSQ